MSNSTEEISSLNPILSVISPHQKIKKKRNMPGNPDPGAEVIALTPKDLLATNRFICEICNKGFQRDQNLQLHRRGHNLPWKLRQKVVGAEIKKRVYVCPEPSCVHHHPSRALGDLTGIKKHFSRKHGEKRWKCEKCSKRYAVQSDWKAHSKLCGTREYKCDCGTLFTRKDSFITHRAFCDALAEESARLISSTRSPPPPPLQQQQQLPPPLLFPLQNPTTWAPLPFSNPKPELMNSPFLHQYNTTMLSHMPATALLQKACNVGSAAISSAKQTQPVGNTLSSSSSVTHLGTGMPLALGYKSFASLQKNEGMTRDFLGLASECGGGNMHWKHLLSLEDFSTYDGDYPLLVRGGVGMGLDEFTSKTWGDCSKLDPT